MTPTPGTRSVDPTSDRSVYRQLADILREQIHTGVLAPGAPLPSELRLAQEHGIGRETVRAAIAILRAEGLIITRQGHRTRVRPRPAQATVVTLHPGDRVHARMPTEPERRSLGLGIDDGVPILEVTRAGTRPDHGHTTRAEVYPGDEYTLRVE